ncbi:MAG: PorT family protein [Bacteroidales bacterium]|nr:PorT family protein [Bacteroidales bacterium]MCF8403104.1 PorT family protein [Bacteroidales bacterium]
MFKIVIFLILFQTVFFLETNYAQTKPFEASIIFNTNGIHILGQDAAYWSGSGSIAGNGGLSLGASIKRNISKPFYSSLELRYIRKGSIYEFIDDNGLQSFEVLKLRYLEMPVMIGYIVRPHKNYRILETGFAVSRLFASSISLDKLNKRTDTPDAANFRDMDISWVGAVKLPLNWKKADNLLFGLRVEHSLFSIHIHYILYNLVYGLQLEYSI